MKKISTTSFLRLLAFPVLLTISQTAFGQITILNDGATGNSITGCAPLNVSFEAPDGGPGASYQWVFGDGNSVTLTNRNASRIYTLPDNEFNFTYTVTLTIINGGITTTETATVKVQSVPEPVFTAEPREGCLVNGAHEVTFTAPEDFVQYDWEFGDGNSATTTTNVYTHNYTAQGDFLPSLIVTDDQGCRAAYNAPTNEQISVSDNFEVEIELDGDVFSCTTPHSVVVRAVDYPVGVASEPTFTWDFGDAVSFVQTPGTEEYTVTWDTPGVKTVGFEAEQSGCSQERRTREVLIDQIEAEFTINNASGCAPLSSRFRNTTANLDNDQQIATWRIYDDGGILIEEIVRNGPGGDNTRVLDYVFPDPETSFEVELLVQDANTPPDCESTSTRQTVEVLPEVIANFTALDPTFSCTAPYTVNFDASSTSSDPSITTYEWEFTDVNGNVIGNETGQTPSFQFNDFGLFGVRLVASANGCEDEIAFDQLITIEPLEADFSFLPPERCVPTNAEAVGLVVGGCVNPSTNLTYSPQLFNRSTGADPSAGTTFLWEVFNSTTLTPANRVASSTMENPTNIVLADEGRYTVRLTLTNPSGCGAEEEVKEDYIWVGLQPDNIDFEATPKIICNGETVNYPRFNSSTMTSYIDDNDIIEMGNSNYPDPEYYYNYLAGNDIMDQAGSFTYAFSDPNPVTASMWYYHNGCFECVEERRPEQHFSNIKLPKADAEFFFDACQPNKIFFNDLSLIPERDRNEIVDDFNAALPLPFPPAAIEWSFTYDDDGTNVPLDGPPTMLNDANPVIMPEAERLINWSVTVRASCDPSNPFTRCDDPADEDTYTCEETLTGTVTLPQFGMPNWEALITDSPLTAPSDASVVETKVDECAILEDVFFDASAIEIPGANIVSYYLEFGNGEILRVNDPANFTATIDYPLPGLYSLRMVLTTDRGCRFEHVYPDWIRVTGPQAIFDYCESGTCADEAIDQTNFFERPDRTATPPENEFAVRFNDVSTSQDEIIEWNWNFGDGTTLEINKISETQYNWEWRYDLDGDGNPDFTENQTKPIQDVVYYSYNRTNLNQDDFFIVQLEVSDGKCSESVATGKVRPTKPSVVVNPADIVPQCFGSLATFTLDLPSTTGVRPFQGAVWEITSSNVEILEGYHPDVAEFYQNNPAPGITFDVVTLFDYDFENERWEIQQTLTPSNGADDIELDRTSFPQMGNQPDLGEVRYFFPGIDGQLNTGTTTVYDASFTLFDINTCPDTETFPSFFQIENYAFDLAFGTSLDPNAVTDNTLFDFPGVPEFSDGTPSTYSVGATPALSTPFYVGGCPPQDIYVNALIELQFTPGANETNQEVTSFNYTDNLIFNEFAEGLSFQWQYIGEETINKTAPSPPHFFTYPNPQNPVDPYDVALRIVDESGCFAEVSYQDVLNLQGPRGTFTISDEQGYADPTDISKAFIVEFTAIPDDPATATDYEYVWDYGVGITSEASPLLTEEFNYTEDFITIGEEFKEYIPKLIMIEGSCSVNAPDRPIVTVYRCPQPDLGPDQTLCISEGDIVIQPFPDGYEAPMPGSTLQYQWFKDEVELVGETSATLTLPAIPGDHVYRVRTSVIDDETQEVCIFEDKSDTRFEGNEMADNEIRVVFYDFADAVFNITPALSTSASYGGAQVICAGEEITIQDGGSRGPLAGAMGAELPIEEWRWTITHLNSGTVVSENRTTDADVVFTPSETGTYIVQLEIIPEAIDGIICGSVVNTEFIAVPPPEPNFTPKDVCYEVPITFFNTTTYSVDQTLNAANATYLWQIRDLAGDLVYTSSELEPTYAFLQDPPLTYLDGPLEYTVTLTVNSNIKDMGTGDDDSGCEVMSEPLEVQINPLPDIEFTDMEACPNEIIEVRPEVTNPEFTYTWSQVSPTSGGTIAIYSDAEATTLAPLSSGLDTYYMRVNSFNTINTPVEAEFQLLVTDNTYPTLCQARENITITFNPFPEIDQRDQEECEEVDITTGTPLEADRRYEWSFADPADEFTNGTVQYFDPADLNTPRELDFFNTAGTFNEIVVRAEVDSGTDAMIGTLQLDVFNTITGCTDNVQNELQFNPIPELDFGDDQEVCDGTDVTLGVPSESNFQYVWAATVAGGSVQYFDPANLSTPMTIGEVNAENLSEIVTRGIISGQSTVTLDMTLEIIDNNFSTACQSADDIQVLFNPLPDVVAQNQVVCEDERITTGTPVEPNRRYEWAITSDFSEGTPSFFTSSGSPISLSNINSDGIYNEIQVGISNVENPSEGVLELTVINTLTECENTANHQLRFNPLPDPILGPDQEVCENTDVTIGLTPVAGFRYTWTPLDLSGGSFQYFNPANLSSPLTLTQVNNANLGEIVVRGIFAGQDPVSARFELEAIDQRFGTNCTTTDETSLQFNPEPENPLEAVPPAVCEGESIVVSVPETSGFNYRWELLTPATNLRFAGSNNASRNLSQITGNAVTIDIDLSSFPEGVGVLPYDIQLTVIDENFPTNCENTEVITIEFYRDPKLATQAIKPGDEGSQEVALSPIEEEVDTFEYQWTQTELQFGTVQESSLTGHTLTINNPVYDFGEPEIKGQYIVNIRNADNDGDPDCGGDNFINFTLFRQPQLLGIEEYREEPCSPRSVLTPIGDEYIPEFLYDWTVEEVIGGDIQVFEAPTDTLFITTVGINSFDEGSATATVRAQLKVRNSLMLNNVDNAAEDNAAIVTKDLIFYRTPDFEIETVKTDSCAQEAVVTPSEELIEGFNYQWTQQSISGGTFTATSLSEQQVTLSAPVYDAGSHKVTANYDLQVVNAAETACQLTQNTEVEIYRTPLVDIQKDKDMICQGERITLNPIDEPVAGFDYTWELVEITEGCNLDINAQVEPVLKQHTIWLDNPTFAPQATVINARYRLVVFNKDAPSCRNEDFVEVTVYRTPIADAQFERDGVCEEDTIYLNTLQAEVNDFIYDWSIVEGSVTGGAISLEGEDDYLLKANLASFEGMNTKVSARLKIQVTNPDKAECTDEDEIDISFFRRPDISISVDKTEACEDGVFTFTLNEEVNPGFTYEWDLAGIEGGTVDVAEQDASKIVVVNPTFDRGSSKVVLAYKLRVFNPENEDCIDEDSRQVTFYRTPEVVIPTPELICQSQPLLLRPNEEEIEGFTYEWIGNTTGGRVETSRTNRHEIRIDATAYSANSNLLNGTYRLRVTNKDFPSCTSEGEVSFQISRIPNLIAQGDLEFCRGESFTVNAVNAPEANIRYRWFELDQNGALVTTASQTTELVLNNQTISGAGTRFYRIVAVNPDDPAQCENVDTLRVTVHPRPIVNFAFSNPVSQSPIQFENLTTLERQANGNPVIGSELAEWAWDFGDGSTSTEQNPSHIFQSAGTYTVRLTATTNRGCSVTLAKEIVISQKPEANFTVTDVCFDKQPVQFTDNSTLNVPRGANDIITDWIWNFGDGSPIIEEKNPTHTFAQAGTYTITLIVGTNKNAFDTLSREIGIFPPIAANFSIENGCASQLATFRHLVNEASERENIESYTWNFGDGTTVTVAEADVQHEYQAIGLYEVSLTVTTKQGCEQTKTEEVTINSTPVAQFTSTNNCVGQQVRFESISTLERATGIDARIVSYAWEFGDGTTSQSQDAADRIVRHVYQEEGAYSVTLTAITNQGCSASVTQEIYVSPVPEASFVQEEISCDNEPITFMSTSTISSGNLSSFVWDFGDGAIYTSESASDTTAQHQYSTYGVYTVRLTVTSDSGCVATSERQILVDPAPIARFDAPTVCEGDESTFDASLSTIALGNIIRYEWDFDNDGAFDESSTSAIVKHTFARFGEYPVQLKITTDKGCVDTLTQFYTVEPFPLAGFSSTRACIGNPTEFAAAINPAFGDVVAYEWDFDYRGGTPIYEAEGANVRFTYPEPGRYNVRHKITTSAGCVDIIEKTVVVDDAPSVDAGEDRYICIGESVILSATGSGETFEWNTGAKSQEIEVSPTEDTQYVVSVTTEVGCFSFDTVNVFILPVVELIAETQGCEGESITLKPNTEEFALFDNVRYEWSTNERTPMIAVSESGTYSLRVIVTEGGKQCISEDSTVVTINSLPTTDMPSDTVACFEDGPVVIDAAKEGVVAWNWRELGKNTSEVSITQEGLYYVDMFTEAGCTDFDSIRVWQVCEPRIFFPTAFTPNDDGLNDTFIPKGKYFVNYELTIYNRWGEVIFRTRDPLEGWDGIYRFDEMPAGTYAYMVKYSGERIRFDGRKTAGRLITEYGSVSLIR